MPVDRILKELRHGRHNPFSDKFAVQETIELIKLELGGSRSQGSPLDSVRVFYEVDEPKKLVRVVAFGIKERNKLTIGGNEIEI